MCEAKHLVAALCLWAAVTVAASQETEAATVDKQEKGGKVVPLFNVVKFVNDVCAGTNSRNGTCFTSQECSDKGGTSSGSCADGFGVCCTFVLACGGTTSANNTYLLHTTTTTIVNKGCIYSICPVATSICRIRYDFTSFVLAKVAEVTSADTSPAVAGFRNAGDCVNDGFSVTGPTGSTSPVICGTNTGEHMIVDSDGMNCQTANFYLDGKSTTSAWDIWVTQYQCTEMDTTRAGPKGCLQYFTGKTNIVKSFAFRNGDTVTSTVTVATSTHLNNQDYTVCIRRELGVSSICWTPIGSAGTAGIAQGNYGISVTGTGIIAAAASAVQTSCSQDFITIPGAATAVPATQATSILDRFCGRAFNTNSLVIAIAHKTICSLTVPFALHVHFDGSENLVGASTNGAVDESANFPSGTLGFALSYLQA